MGVTAIEYGVSCGARDEQAKMHIISIVFFVVYVSEGTDVESVDVCCPVSESAWNKNEVRPNSSAWYSSSIDHACECHNALQSEQLVDADVEATGVGDRHTVYDCHTRYAIDGIWHYLNRIWGYDIC